MIKLTIAIPTTGFCTTGFAYSLSGLTSYHAAKGISSRPKEGLELRVDVIESSVIHSNREKLVKRAIEAEQTHLAFFDTDMTFGPDVLDIMFGRFQPIVVTNYLIKTEDEQFVAVGLDGKRIPTRKESTGIAEIAYSGFGASLFEIDAWRRTPQPWFLPHFVPEENSYTTEDHPAFERLRVAGFKVYLDHDASKSLGHTGGRTWRWDMREQHGSDDDKRSQ